MNGRDAIDMLAAEYVLGTLDPAERSDVAARRDHEPELAAAIEAWEARLGPLAGLAGEAEPPDLLPTIEARILAQKAPRTSTSPTTPEVNRLRAQLRRWRATALVGLAAAAGLAGILVWHGPLMPPSDQRFVAVFQENDQPPSFLLSIDLESRELTIRPIAAEPRPGKAYQLWVVGGKLGPKPRSLGLLDSPVDPTQKRLSAFDADDLRKATFGISLEPAGGSPTGQPSGPAIHGTLIPVDR